MYLLLWAFGFLCGFLTSAIMAMYCEPKHDEKYYIKINEEREKEGKKNMNKIVIGLIVCLMVILSLGACATAKADAATPAPSIADILNGYGATAGYFYGVRATHGYSYLAVKLATLGPEGWHLDLDGGMIATSGAALTVDYDLMKAFSLKQVPILGFFDTAKIGGGGMVTDITAFSDGGQINGVDNRLDWGADGLLSKTVKF
jgi:hypothetical protein